MLSNYPAGANTPDAPFNQPMLSDECAFEHADHEECSGISEAPCSNCGTECCEHALIERRVTAHGRTITVKTCIDCAERFMVPGMPDAAVALLNRAMNHSMSIPGISTDEYLDNADHFMGCVAWVLQDMAAKRRENTEAVLRFARVA